MLNWADAILGHFAEYPLLMNLLDTNPAAFDKAVWQFFKAASVLRRQPDVGGDVVAQGLDVEARRERRRRT